MAVGSWHPQSFRRFEQAFASSTYPARIVTDAGPAFIKVINNPLGPHVLVREWVGTSLAHWFGLPTFDFAILELDELDKFFLHDNRIQDEGIYGLFPEFIPFVKTKELRAATSRLRELDVETISDIMADIPSAWLVSAETREALSELILQRARYTADTVVDRIQTRRRLYSGSLLVD